MECFASNYCFDLFMVILISEEEVFFMVDMYGSDLERAGSFPYGAGEVVYVLVVVLLSWIHMCCIYVSR